MFILVNDFNIAFLKAICYLLNILDLFKFINILYILFWSSNLKSIKLIACSSVYIPYLLSKLFISGFKRMFWYLKTKSYIYSQFIQRLLKMTWSLWFILFENWFIFRINWMMWQLWATLIISESLFSSKLNLLIKKYWQKMMKSICLKSLVRCDFPLAR